MRKFRTVLIGQGKIDHRDPGRLGLQRRQPFEGRQYDSNHAMYFGQDMLAQFVHASGRRVTGDVLEADRDTFVGG